MKRILRSQLFLESVRPPLAPGDAATRQRNRRRHQVRASRHHYRRLKRLLHAIEIGSSRSSLLSSLHFPTAEDGADSHSYLTLSRKRRRNLSRLSTARSGTSTRPDSDLPPPWSPRSPRPFSCTGLPRRQPTPSLPRHPHHHHHQQQLLQAPPLRARDSRTRIDKPPNSCTTSRSMCTRSRRARSAAALTSRLLCMAVRRTVALRSSVSETCSSEALPL